MLESHYNETLIEAGCDEVGRGCLAGSLFAAAVILPKDFYHPLLNDSKKMSERQRLLLQDVIREQAIAWAIGEATAQEIDAINVLNASFLAMTRAVEALTVTPEFLLIDGNRFSSSLTIPHVCIVKGDSKFAAIAAASVLAKCHRDKYISLLGEEYPEYQWGKNKAYPTAFHRAAIEKYGVTPHHRLTFGK
ncbi:MAG: ribonuclease HII [Rikenellaceae bacterium]